MKEASRKRKEMNELTEEQRLQNEKSPAGEGNILLAGYLAHEFLTDGTLFGRRWGLTEVKQHAEGNAKKENPPRGYVEVARLIEMDVAHIAGIVNPTQLALWLQK